MNIMRLRIGAFAFIGALMLSTSTYAGTVVVTDYTGPNTDFLNRADNPVGDGQGGPFRATIGPQSFLTFCLELSEALGLGVVYNFTTSDRAFLGGKDDEAPQQPGDPLSDATKWLYYQSRVGGYAAVFSGNPILSLVAPNDRGAVIQEALWMLEDEYDYAVGTPAQELASIALAANWNALAAKGARVFAINPTTVLGNENRQSILSMPEAASTMMVFGLGIAALSFTSRRLRANRR
jgi:hypothetical protein